METVNMILFKKRQISTVLQVLNIQMEERGKLLDENGEPITCHTCGSKLRTKNLGNIMPGSRLFFCDNPLCFATYLSERKVTRE